MRRFSSVLGLVAGIAAAIVFAASVHLKEWSWIGGLVLGVAVAAVVSRLLYGFNDARRLDTTQPQPGSYASRTLIQNITGGAPDPALHESAAAETAESGTTGPDR